MMLMTTSKKMNYILGTFVVVIFSILLSKSKVETETEKQVTANEWKATPSAAPRFPHENKKQDPTAKVKDFLSANVKRVGMIDKNPEKTAQDLMAKAESFNPIEIQFLKSQVLNSQLSNDGRFLAVYLIGHNKSQMANQALKAIAIEPIKNGNERQMADEMIIRAQALEFIGKRDWSAEKKKALLHEILTKSNNSFVTNWARKNLSP